MNTPELKTRLSFSIAELQQLAAALEAANATALYSKIQIALLKLNAGMPVSSYVTQGTRNTNINTMQTLGYAITDAPQMQQPMQQPMLPEYPHLTAKELKLYRKVVAAGNMLAVLTYDEALDLLNGYNTVCENDPIFKELCYNSPIISYMLIMNENKKTAHYDATELAAVRSQLECGTDAGSDNNNNNNAVASNQITFDDL